MTDSEPDIVFHYPPELFNLLVDTIPLLNRSKKDVLLFFRGAGVQERVTGDLWGQVRSASDTINKFEIARTVLERLNSKGEAALQLRRQVLRRVVEFSNFDTCWPNDQLKAKGLVAAVRDVVNQKDSFTRIRMERDEERNARLAKAERESRARREKLERIESAKREFFALFGAPMTPQERGKKLEAALNTLFSAYGVLVQEAFHLIGNMSEGIVEQIDGVIELKGNLYFVEMKWHKAPVGVPEVSEHLVRLMGRAEANGIIISASEYSKPAVSTSREFLQQKVVVLMNLREIVELLEQKYDLESYLWSKIQAAIVHKNPYFLPFDTLGEDRS